MLYRSLRNITAALLVSATAASAALVPTSASAHMGHFGGGFGGGHWGHGWGHGYSYGGYAGGCWPHRYFNYYGELVWTRCY